MFKYKFLTLTGTILLGAVGLGLGLWIKLAATVPQSPPVARLSEVTNAVSVCSPEAGCVPAHNGLAIHVTDQVKTAAAASVKLVFADSAVVRLLEKTSLTVQQYTPSYLIRLSLLTGRIDVNLVQHGTLLVHTAAGEASISGSFGTIIYQPTNTSSPNGTLTLDCLEGQCRVNTPASNVTVSERQRGIFYEADQPIFVNLSDIAYETFIFGNPESREVLEAMAAAPAPMPTVTGPLATQNNNPAGIPSARSDAFLAAVVSISTDIPGSAATTSHSAQPTRAATHPAYPTPTDIATQSSTSPLTPIIPAPPALPTDVPPPPPTDAPPPPYPPPPTDVPPPSYP